MIYFHVFPRLEKWNGQVSFRQLGIYIIEEKKHHIVCIQWVKIRIFVTYRIKDILSFIKVKSAVYHEVLLVVAFHL